MLRDRDRGIVMAGTNDILEVAKMTINASIKCNTVRGHVINVKRNIVDLEIVWFGTVILLLFFASGFAVPAMMRMHCFIGISAQVKIFLVIYPNGFYYKIVVGK